MSKHTTRRYPGKTLEEKFWLYTSVGAITDCWIWHGPTDGDEGYGRVCVGRRTSIYAHRLSYQIHNGPIPDGLDILHSCDNPQCVNPCHLRAGTHLDNMKDMIARGHLVQPEPRRGESNHFSKLTEAAVIEIRALHEAGIPRRTIALRFGIVPGTVTKIVSRQRWNHIP